MTQDNTTQNPTQSETLNELYRKECARLFHHTPRSTPVNAFSVMG
jgi:hypothetical protein